ncbi:MAG: branched-chain amino acid ABC transporter permease [Rhodospirillales bacterium]|nr:branched-chain amino acid ABC transporter permease [Rhodospirillales bacterium]
MDFLQTSIDGLLFGSAYALLALGFSLIFGIMKRINLAYGSSLLFGGALAVWLEPFLGGGALGLLLVTVFGAAVAGIYVERLCFSPHLGKTGTMASMIATFAIWMQLDEISSQLLPQRTHGFAGIDIEAISFAGIILRSDHVLHFWVAVLAIGALYWTLYRTRFGLLLRASADDPEIAYLLGGRVGLLGVATFAIAGFLGGTAAFLILSSDGQITPHFGLWSTFKGLVAMMLGGVGSLPGAIVGGLLLGFAEAHVTFYLGAEFRDILTFGLLLLILVLRPGGLMGVDVYRTGRLATERI